MPMNRAMAHALEHYRGRTRNTHDTPARPAHRRMPSAVQAMEKTTSESRREHFHSPGSLEQPIPYPSYSPATRAVPILALKDLRT